MHGARAEARRDRARLARASAWPTTSSASAIARSATSRSSASTSPRRRPRCTPPATAAISRWSTRCRASRSRSWGATTKRCRRCATRSGSPSMVHADDVLATVCGNQANVMMLQHRHEQALALAERSVVAARSARLRARPRRRARDARPDLRAPRRSGPRRGRAAPRARGAQPDSVPRDDRRGRSTRSRRFT